MALFKRPLTIVIPDTSVGLGWAGGNQYIKNLAIALKNLEREKTFWLARAPLSHSWSALQYRLRRTTHTTHLPWTHTSLPGVNPPTIEVQWIPDLQDIELPHFFSQLERDNRAEQIQQAIGRGARFFVSSNHAASVARTAYPCMNLLGVVRFSCRPEMILGNGTAPKPSLECRTCRQQGFIYWPSQLWKHKNHFRVLNAIKQSRISAPHIVVSGPEFDYRWPEYPSLIRNLMAVCGNIHALGDVRESERTWLLKNCRAVFQPSLYEGWSTTIEEAILFGKPVIVSSIPPNLEQTQDYSRTVFVDPESELSIVSGLTSGLDRIATTIPAHDELLRIRQIRWNRFEQDLSHVISRLLDGVSE